MSRKKKEEEGAEDEEKKKQHKKKKKKRRKVKKMKKRRSSTRRKRRRRRSTRARQLVGGGREGDGQHSGAKPVTRLFAASHQPLSVLRCVRSSANPGPDAPGRLVFSHSVIIPAIPGRSSYRRDPKLDGAGWVSCREPCLHAADGFSKDTVCASETHTHAHKNTYMRS